MISKASAVRASGVVEQPEQFVTVEIHNSSLRKKQRNHRQSIINEMKHTETLLEQTLNRDLRHPRSKFSPAPPRPARTEQSTPRLTHARSGELSRKLNQLCNISQHFDHACELRHRALPTLPGTEETPYALPAATPAPLPSLADRKAKEELIEHRTMVREWEAKVRLGRDFVQRAKKRHPLRLRPPLTREDNPTTKPNLRSLRDLYYSDLRAERKTAPASNNLELLFLRGRGGMGYAGGVQEEQALQLQRFVAGGQEGVEGEFGEWLSLSQFRRNKERYQMLERLYNHVKETNLFEFKDMGPDSFSHQSLLAIVYYLENANNLSENDRRALKKKLRIVE